MTGCPTLSLSAGACLDMERRGRPSLILVEEGVVFVAALQRGSARRMVVAMAGAGSAMIAPAADERVEALSDARLTAIDERAKRELLAIPGAATVLTNALMESLRESQETLSHFANPRHADRLRGKLTQLARTHGKVAARGVWLDLPLTHELLADMIGSKRETVTRALARLAEEGFVRYREGAYVLAVEPESLGR